MLNEMRALSQNWIGRSIMAVVLGFIILSFAVWGIGDRFTNFNGNELAKVGSARLTVDDYRNAYQNQLQRMQQQQKRGITNEEARRLGIDRQVLSRLLTDSVLEQEAAKLGLAVSDKDVGKAIVADPLFKGQNGQFDANRFHELLRDNGLTETSYAHDQRGIMLRQDVSDAVIGGLDVPQTMEDAISRYKNEVRDVDYFILPPTAAGAIPAPSDADLKKYYDDRPTAFVAPEYRKLNVLSIVPVDLVKPDGVSDDDVKKRYEEFKAARFAVPEKRDVQQLVFPDDKAADAAAAKLAGGESFDKLVADEKKSPSDVSLGTMTRDEIADKAVGDAAFALQEGGTSQPVKGQFGTVLVHVGKIAAGHEQPLMEVSAQLKDELAIIRAKSQASTIRDKIEDARSAGKTLTEAAASVGLEVRPIEAIDAQGRDKAHRPVEGLVDGPTLLKAAFATDVGADTEVIRTGNGGDVWYEVVSVDPSHKLPLDAVKAEVTAKWRADETERRLAAASDTIVAAMNGGKTMAVEAADSGKAEVMKAENVGRGGGPSLPPQVAGALFNVPVGKSGSSPLPDHGRLIFRVEAARVPPINPADTDFTKLMEQVKSGVTDDVIAQYLAAVQNEIGVKINQQALQTALGGDNGS
jgi:peptidyl-prolyl cis-trans isomerase D